MTKCPHCDKELFHEKSETPIWTKERGSFEQYTFECYCLKFHTLYESKIPGFSKSVTDKGDLISVSIYLPEQYEIKVYYIATNVAYISELGTFLYGLTTNEKSRSKYKIKELITKVSEIKDLQDIDLSKLRSWAETLATFS